MTTSLNHILNFTDLLLKFRTIERRILQKKSDKKENDAEHSFQLAMLAWYINKTLKLGLDQQKLFMYSLAHDLVEIYAGDTYFYLNNKDEEEKKRREEEALEKIKKEVPEFPEMTKIIENYERRDDTESKFIYALDKIEPVLHIYLDNGRTWKEQGVTFEMLMSKKIEKVSIHPATKKIFEELVSRLKSEHSKLFS